MRLRIERFVIIAALLAGVCAADPQPHFAVIGAEPGAWPAILSSVGFVRQDSDLAKIYGVTTKRLNEQAKRNRGRFPPSLRSSLPPKNLQT